MPIYLPELTVNSLVFPPVSQALTEPDGLLAMGGDLSVARLTLAYQSGIFPWFADGDPLLWWSPGTRAVFPPNTLQLNRTLRKQWQKSDLQITLNHDFAAVVKLCAAPRPNQAQTWILPDIQQAYITLHRQGLAHSIEIWQQQQLVGGLYGVQLGQLFCGESMFNRIDNGAKFALVALQQHLQRYAPGWIDCQLPNPFLLKQGASTMPRADYLELLQQLRTLPAPAKHWQAQTLTLQY
ncbi:leucyl/phenylalanyl-tRNA--protein transferase [Alishewanella sp. HL-SH05]|uniref:leucyl/phenylalanyl-tRNA--protein transferase n=1 Tax=Alishewanella sp. HL-SH05 TaxID=3461145 RepID=UPI0040417C9D